MSEENTVHVRVDPGVCGFPCAIRVRKAGARAVAVEIDGSECKQIRLLSERLVQLTLKELFLPMTKNPVYVAATETGCHPSCAIPVGVVKAAEVALGLAVPKAVRIDFEA